MIAMPYDYFLVGWFVLAALSTAYVACDQYREQSRARRDEVGLHPRHALHGSDRPAALRHGRQGAAAGRARGVRRPLWKQGVGSTIHCVAGDATGIILAAVDHGRRSACRCGST